jgi:chaperonin cofactor prefoldin
MEISLDECNERIKKEEELLAGELKVLAEGMGECEEEMKGLKARLYAKFGDAINLEKD